MNARIAKWDRSKLYSVLETVIYSCLLSSLAPTLAFNHELGQSKQLLSYKLLHVYQLSLTLIFRLTRRKQNQNNFHTNSCLSTLVNFHLCLTRSKESQNNFRTNSCLPTLINSHPTLTCSLGLGPIEGPIFSREHSIDNTFMELPSKGPTIIKCKHLWLYVIAWRHGAGFSIYF